MAHPHHRPSVAGVNCATGKVEAQALAVMEGQLTWLVHLVGAIIRGRLSSSSAESQVNLNSRTAATLAMDGRLRDQTPTATARRLPSPARSLRTQAGMPGVSPKHVPGRCHSV